MQSGWQTHRDLTIVGHKSAKQLAIGPSIRATHIGPIQRKYKQKQKT